MTDYHPAHYYYYDDHLVIMIAGSLLSSEKLEVFFLSLYSLTH